MNSSLRFSFGGMFLFMSLFSSFGQNEPFKFGKVSMAELEMKSSHIDSSAPATYLFKYGYFDQNRLNFTMQVRIKIFKKEGYPWATFSMPATEYSAIRGYTYNLENGKIVESKLRSESIFKEKIVGIYYQYNLTMPNVKEGSVLDIEFIYPGFPWEWRFQEQIPVEWSELIMPPTGYVEFTKNFFGFESLNISTDVRWVAKDMPAFKTEPFINSYKNYITKFEFDIKGIGTSGPRSHSFATSWDQISKLLIDDPYFGQLLGSGSFLTSIAREITNKYKNKEERIKAAFDALKILKWNERESIFSAGSLNTVFKNKLGNSGELCLMLVQLLRKLDIDADPIVMSSRENGLLDGSKPTIIKLNYALVQAKTDTKTYLLDPSEEYAPYYLLPKRALNGYGRLIKFSGSEPVEINADRKDKSYSIYNLTLDENLKLTGKISYIKDEYAALDFRNNYFKYNSIDEYLENFKKDKNGLIIDKSEIKNLDSLYLPIEELFDVQINNQIKNTGELFYLYPMFYECMKENLFKSETRKIPVDFAYPIEKNVIIKIILPDNLVVTDMPKPVVMKLPDNAAVFSYKLAYANNILQVIYKLSINKSNYTTEEYLLLREIFHQIISKHAEPVILKKK
jgi:hypothetical protein